MNEKFTPGPWHILGDGEVVIITTDEALNAPGICGMSGWQTHDVNRANAALVSAAPEMYVALEYVMNHCSLYGAADQARELIRTALEKAQVKP